jgi:hypothetical protein
MAQSTAYSEITNLECSKVKKNLLFFESNILVTIFGTFYLFPRKSNNHPSYIEKSSFQRIISFSDEFPLLLVIKTIHSECRGNLHLKTDKFVIKCRDFNHEVLLIPFEMAKN